jgi:hypothetical protein
VVVCLKILTSKAAKFVGALAEGLLSDCPKATAKHVTGHLKRTLGANITYRTAQRGKRLRIEDMTASETVSFQYIQPYFQKIEKKMPGSVAVMERDKDNKLLCTFVMLDPMIESFKFGLPVLSVDACHLRNQFKGCLMAITMIHSLKQT